VGGRFVAIGFGAPVRTNTGLTNEFDAAVAEALDCTLRPAPGGVITCVEEVLADEETVMLNDVASALARPLALALALGESSGAKLSSWDRGSDDSVSTIESSLLWRTKLFWCNTSGGKQPDATAEEEEGEARGDAAAVEGPRAGEA
jgi:hypothetical protein